MIHVREFEEHLYTLLPVTYTLLQSSNFVVHEKVSRVTLHGSRGLAGGFRPDSDIDLSLIVDIETPAPLSDLEPLLSDVLQTTVGNWQSPVEADLAAIVDVRACGLKCFERSTWASRLCTQGGVDCFGLYKNHTGRPRFIIKGGVEVEQMYPCLIIYRAGHRCLSAR